MSDFDYRKFITLEPGKRRWQRISRRLHAVTPARVWHRERIPAFM